MPLPLPTQYVKAPDEWEKLSEDAKHFAFYAQMHGELVALRRVLVDHTRVVDEWASAPMGDDLTVPAGTTTQLIPPKAWHMDVVITGITATWPTASTSAYIQLGDRIITLPTALGYVSMVGLKMQLEFEDDRKMVIAPAGACFLQLSGYADLSRAGNRGSQRG